MIKHSVFRQKAMKSAAQPEPNDNLLRVTAPGEWLLVAALAASLVAALVWLGLANVERTVTGAGTLVYAGERRAVSAVSSGVVSEVAARPGDRVDDGQVIARLRLPELDWRLRVARERLALLEALAEEDGATEDWVRVALAEAGVEVVELAASASAAGAVTSPFAGEITTSRLAPDYAVSAGEAVAEIRVGGDDSLEAVMFASAADGGRVAAGMPARVMLGDGPNAAVFAASVVSIAPPPAGYSRFDADRGARPEADTLMVRLALRDAPDFPVADGLPCRVRIVLERSSPLGLLLPSAGAADQ